MTTSTIVEDVLIWTDSGTTVRCKQCLTALARNSLKRMVKSASCCCYNLWISYTCITQTRTKWRSGVIPNTETNPFRVSRSTVVLKVAKVHKIVRTVRDDGMPYNWQVTVSFLNGTHKCCHKFSSTLDDPVCAWNFITIFEKNSRRRT